MRARRAPLCCGLLLRDLGWTVCVSCFPVEVSPGRVLLVLVLPSNAFFFLACGRNNKVFVLLDTLSFRIRVRYIVRATIPQVVLRVDFRCFVPCCDWSLFRPFMPAHCCLVSYDMHVHVYVASVTTLSGLRMYTTHKTAQHMLLPLLSLGTWCVLSVRHMIKYTVSCDFMVGTTSHKNSTS